MGTAPRRDPSKVDARAEIEHVLEASRSLKTELAGDIERQTERAIDLALRDLRRHEKIDLATVALLRAASYTEKQALGDWFPGDRRISDKPRRDRGRHSPIAPLS